MANDDREYFRGIYDIGKEMTGGVDEKFLDFADEILLGRKVSKEVAAVISGLSGYVAYLLGHLQLKEDQISEARGHLAIGQTDDADDVLARSQGDYSQYGNPKEYYPRIAVDNTQSQKNGEVKE
jgi:hypothetical protein